MPLYILSGKVKGKSKKLNPNTRLKPPKNVHTAQARPQPFYPVEPPQEFDEPGKELGLDAQVWKTYVREADQVDGELVDGWNKSTDVILIFVRSSANPAALFSAISTAFVIESYKSLVPDPADASAQTLLVISQTLKVMANASALGEQPSPDAQLDIPSFSASWSAICVNALWFLSLSLSVAVTLISMLAKEWCLTFMSGRTGPPGAQARRRQQRWEGLLGWRMKEVLMVLPLLIHLSLLLFAIGICVFLWSIHIGVAIPVVFVTTVAASAYMACTVLPFLDRYCPYGTVISMMIKRFQEIRTRTPHQLNDATQDETTANALHWMVTNCETPRSVDVALQSLAGAASPLPRNQLVKLNIWTMIKRRLSSVDTNDQGMSSNPSNVAFMRALGSVTVVGNPLGSPDHGLSVETQRLEVLTLGLQSCIDSICYGFEKDASCDLNVKRILSKCVNAGVRLLKTREIMSARAGSKEELQSQALWVTVDLEKLCEEVTGCLEQHLNGELDLSPTIYTVLCTSLGCFLCFYAGASSPSVLEKPIMRLLRAYISHTSQLKHEWILGAFGSRVGNQAERSWAKQSSRDRELIFLLGIIPLLYDTSGRSLQHEAEASANITNARLETAIESIWAFLITVTYSGADNVNRWTQSESGALYLLRRISDHSMGINSCLLLISFMDQEILSLNHSGRPSARNLSNSAKQQLMECVHEQLSTRTDAHPVNFAPQSLAALVRYLPVSSGDEHLIIRLDLYMSTVRNLCNAKTSQERQTCYQLMSRLPFPRISPRFVDLLAANEVVGELSTALDSDNPAIQTFATAQLWLLFNISIQFPDRQNRTLTSLEQQLLKYPLPDGDLSKQDVVAKQLEKQFRSFFAKQRFYFWTELGSYHDSSGNRVNSCAYLYRILECILQERGESLSEEVNSSLEGVPGHLRGLGSSIYFEGDADT